MRLSIFLLCGSAAGMEPADHRALQDSTCDIFTGVQNVNEACCVSGHRRTQVGGCDGQSIPQTCSASCAQVFIPFLDNCGTSLGILGFDLNDFYALYYSCHQVNPDPCSDVECGEHGSPSDVEDGQCRCDGDFKGDMCSALLPHDAQHGQWSSLAPMPTTRSYLGLTTADGILYAVGGRNNGNILNDNEAYDVAAGTWSTLAPMPTARSNLGLTAADGILYAVGGYNNDGDVINLNEAYDVAVGTWSTLAPMPTARSYLGLTAADGILYAVGGFNGANEVSTAEAYNVAAGTWSALALMPTARSNLGLAAVDGIIYAMGGFNGHNSPYSRDPLNTAEAYDVAAGTWSALAPMPTARYGLGLTATDGILYAVGGYNGNNLNTAEAYDAAAGTWSALAPTPTAREGLGLTAADGILYGVGGVNNDGCLNVNEAYLI
eukprot:SAG22_NODE_131_length_18561_cov_10.941387_11_plen_434_part_00